jgi:hypothetical protein
MLPVTHASLVSLMEDQRVNDGVPEDLRTFLRMEFREDAGAQRMLAEARRRAAPAKRSADRRSVLSALFEALGAALGRPGGA